VLPKQPGRLPGAGSRPGRCEEGRRHPVTVAQLFESAQEPVRAPHR
jgi:hypothetical protein